jgi:hypothetical protein
MDSATNPFNDRRPSKGALAVCMNCGTIGQFDERMNMVPLSREQLTEIQELYPETWHQLRIVQVAIDQMNKRN